MAVKCKNCGGAHPTWDCTKPKIEKAETAKPAAKAKPVPVTGAVTVRPAKAVKAGSTPARHSNKRGGSSAVERLPEKQRVGGSIPSPRTKLVAKKAASKPRSTAGRKRQKTTAAGHEPVAKASALAAKPVATRAKNAPVAEAKKRGRPVTGSNFDKAAWQRDYMRDYRKGIRRKEPA